MDNLFKQMIEQAMNEGKVIHFSVRGGEWSAALGEDVEALSRAELEEYCSELEDRLGDMDDIKPENLDSEEFSLWADAHEELKDLIGEVKDRLSELG